MAMETGSGRDAFRTPGAVVSARTGGPAGQSRTANGQRQVVMLMIGLGAAANLVRSRGFHEMVIVGVIGLAALARMSRENQARNLARVAAWDKRRNLRDQHTRKARPA
jgi:hypothetical protein